LVNWSATGTYKGIVVGIIAYISSCYIFILLQWRRQLVGSTNTGHVGTCPLAFEIFFRYTLKQVVWFGLVLCQTLNL